MSLKSESMRRSVVLSRFHQLYLPPLGQFQLPQVPRRLRPLTEEKVKVAIRGSGGDQPDPMIRAARHAADRAHFDATPLLQARPHDRPRVVACHGAAQFDPGTLVTRATADVTIDSVSDALWAELARDADPQMWSTNAADFFKVSARLPGFDLLPRGGWKGRLLEKFEWNWNPDTTARYENHLHIEFNVDEHEIQLKYWLDACLSTDLGFGSQPGGLDRDGGALTITRNGNSVTSRATKELRYTDPPDAPDGFVLMLSYLTPATLGVWLDQALFQGAMRSIEQTPNP